jgi:putative nucleotidyltransferase with HDIG domain
MWTRICHADTGLVHTATSAITSTDLQQLQNVISEFVIVEHQELPDYLAPFCSLGMRSYLVLPVRVEKAVEAVLVCANRKPHVLELEHVPEARQVTEQLAVAFSHVRLIKALEQLHWGTLTALARAIDAKSEWTLGHSERVTQVAVDIGRNLGLPHSDLRIMQMGGLLHDIGKIGTPPKILDKPGALTDEEMCIMREHVRTGLRIVEPIPGLHDALPIVSQHHEWFNGNGYPTGLAGKEISLYARIFAIADCYDALSSDRPYRKGLPLQQVLSMLRERSGTQFDPSIIEVFMRMMADKNSEGEAVEAQRYVVVP